MFCEKPDKLIEEFIELYDDNSDLLTLHLNLLTKISNLSND